MNYLDRIVKSVISESMDEIMAYHGTNHDFNEFDTAYMGTGYGQQAFGWGVYLCLTKDGAQPYGKILYEVEIPSDEKRYIHADKLYKKTFCDKLIRAIYKQALSDKDSVWKGAEQDFAEELRMTFNGSIYGDSVIGSIEPYVSLPNGKMSREECAAKLLRSLGYFGYKWTSNGYTNVVMFDAKDIHVVSKTNNKD